MNLKRLLQVLALSVVMLGSPTLVQAKDHGDQVASDTYRALGDAVNVQSEIVQAEANQSVAVFAHSKPQEVFERVRLTMADVIEAGRAQSLQDAYILAVDQHFKVTVDNYSKLGLGQDEWFWLLVEREKRPFLSTQK